MEDESQPKKRRVDVDWKEKDCLAQACETHERFSYLSKYDVFCSYCSKDISRDFKIECTVCTDFIACIDCFAAGAQLDSHKNTHPYRIIPSFHDPLFTFDWSGQDELRLISQIKSKGFGNWRDIAENVGKSARACESHYNEVYLESPSAPLPDMSKCIPFGGSGVTLSTKARLEEACKQPTSQQFDAITVPGADLPGFMPLRGDFDVEYENEAEMILADMAFNDDDPPAERELKLRVIEIYNRKLDEREKRKKFVIERNLLDHKRIDKIEKRMTSEERDLYNRMRVFARFHSFAEHEALIQGLLMEVKLRKRVKRLQEYRKLGIQTHAQAEFFEAERKKSGVDIQTALKRALDIAPILHDTDRPDTATNRNRLQRTQEMNDTSHLAGRVGLDLSETTAKQDLTPQEIELCSKLALHPKMYIEIRTQLLQQCAKEGKFDFSRVHSVKVEEHWEKALFDFFINCGFLSSPPAHMSDLARIPEETN